MPNICLLDLVFYMYDTPSKTNLQDQVSSSKKCNKKIKTKNKNKKRFWINYFIISWESAQVLFLRGKLHPKLKLSIFWALSLNHQHFFWKIV